MSTYAALREIVLIYLQQNISLSDPFPGQAISADAKAAMLDTLILRAANSARKRAEKLNDWVLTQVSSIATVPAGESISLLGHTDVNDEEVTFDYKNLVEVTSEGWPINLAGEFARLRKKYLFARSRPRKVHGVQMGNKFRLKPDQDEDEELQFYGHRWMDVYYDVESYFLTGIETPADCNGPLLRFDEDGAAVSWTTTGDVDSGVGTYVRLYRFEDRWSILVFVDGMETVRWVSVETLAATPSPLLATWELGEDYTDGTGTPSLTVGGYSTQTDFLLQQGFDYMQWATLVECNYWAKLFVPRQEGALAPPEKERDRCLDELLRWDTEMLDAQTNFGER